MLEPLKLKNQTKELKNQDHHFPLTPDLFFPYSISFKATATTTLYLVTQARNLKSIFLILATIEPCQFCF